VADAKKILERFKLDKDAVESVGWTDRGFERLDKGLQEDAFNKTADILGTQRGKDANETAGGIVSHVTAPLGNSTAANILRDTLRTGAVAVLNPANLVAPGGPKMLAGRIRNVEQQVAHKFAKDALETGSMDAVNKIAQASTDGLTKIIPRAKPSGLDILRDTRVPADARGLKWVTGDNSIRLPNVKPASPTGVKYIPASKGKTAAEIASGSSIVGTAPGTSTRGHTIEQLNQFAKQLASKKGSK
jgi:hypothetical protein